MTDTEWAARVELASCYRLFDWLGWTLHYAEVMPENLVRIDLEGNAKGLESGRACSARSGQRTR